jgi:hypothetical protein
MSVSTIPEPGATNNRVLPFAFLVRLAELPSTIYGVFHSRDEKADVEFTVAWVLTGMGVNEVGEV